MLFPFLGETYVDNDRLYIAGTLILFLRRNMSIEKSILSFSLISK